MVQISSFFIIWIYNTTQADWSKLFLISGFSGTVSCVDPRKYPWKREWIKIKKQKEKKGGGIMSQIHSIVLASFVLFYTFPSGKQFCWKTISKFHLALVLITGTDTSFCAIFIPLSRSSCRVCSVYWATTLFLMDIIIIWTFYLFALAHERKALRRQ